MAETSIRNRNDLLKAWKGNKHLNVSWESFKSTSYSHDIQTIDDLVKYFEQRQATGGSIQ